MKKFCSVLAVLFGLWFVLATGGITHTDSSPLVGMAVISGSALIARCILELKPPTNHGV